MIIGVGLDLLETARMERALMGERFCARVFTEGERARIHAAAVPRETGAGIFCAKEAFAKAVGIGLFSFGFHEVSVAHEPGGRPFLRLSDRLKTLYPGRFHLSITHTRQTASAVVVYERAMEAGYGANT